MMLALLFLLFLSTASSRLAPAGRSHFYTRPNRPDYERKEAKAQLLDQQRQPLNTVRVTCHPDSLEIHIQADLFDIGMPVHSHEVRLGVELVDGPCIAAPSSATEYRIFVGLLDCGMKYLINDVSLIYTNLLIYTPAPTPDGLIRSDGAVVPIECHYARRYSLSSSSLSPNWIPFKSTQAAEETLDFKLRIMTDDWQNERGANVYYLGEPISIEATVRVGHHVGLRVFLSSCVATLQPDIHALPRYVFIENGCLLDSKLEDSKSRFLVRTQDDKLQFVIDAFRFHDDDRGELYITCDLHAVPVHDTEAPNKACTFVNGRWRSADGNDYLCGYCQNPNEVGQHRSKTAKFSPRGFGQPASPWNSRAPASGWEHQAKLGPMLVLPHQGRWTNPDEQLPPVLQKINKPVLYGSQWMSGLDYLKDPVIGQSSEDDDDATLEDSSLELDHNDAEENELPEPLPTQPEGSVSNSTETVENWPEVVAVATNVTEATPIDSNK
ncbi:zona pellucida sperm-binding protein 3-like [Stigmatopora nigra]